ncbi:hypothetical protein B0J12DRAFT_68259 [Macrophomina phaseolina]|uniref:Uncharacterized protein n=1 Tax=Macrophomina phaseolina TaxID=35725 RepID=A0ABQ8GD13_9PEZI|nr:hypothetical protein B0J12DRAFT_68259 [Macrophomina phaseolina]
MAPINSALARLTRPRVHAFAVSTRPALPATRPQCLVCAARTYAASTERLPRVVQPSLWQNLIPKHFRSSHKRPFTWKEWWAKDWNPASVWIMFALLVGSNAINTLILRRDIADFTRKADAKIALLREVLEKVQKGEAVDVEGILGTGREESEKEWEEALKEIEEEDKTWQSRKRRKVSATEAIRAATSPPSPPANETQDKVASMDHVVPQEKREPIGFY